MQNGDINPTELVASIINQKENFIEGIRYAQEIIDGSLSMLILTPKGIYCARDKMGRTPIVLGKKKTVTAQASRALPTLTSDTPITRSSAPVK